MPKGIKMVGMYKKYLFIVYIYKILAKKRLISKERTEVKKL